MSHLSKHRTKSLNDLAVESNGRFILYWMHSFRRSHWNYSLDRAIEWSNELQKPLIVLETLFVDEPWASDRFHVFALEGMVDQLDSFGSSKVRYYPYLEKKAGEVKKLLKALCQESSIVVTDYYPTHEGRHALDLLQEVSNVRAESVDSNGLLPLQSTSKLFPTAYVFRRHLQKVLPKYFLERPNKHPLKGIQAKTKASVPREILDRWPDRSPKTILEDRSYQDLPIDHEVQPTRMRGGTKEALKVLKTFLEEGLNDYASDRNDVEKNPSSGLSPYLHYGHISVHQIFHELIAAENWTPNQLSEKCDGKRRGWWGMSENAESFLDELITWREIGFNRSHLQENYDDYKTLPDWAQETLSKHADDSRKHVYSLKELEKAKTHDDLWNAAQVQLVSEGVIHNYLRMLWGKKILEWTKSPRDALKIMIELNNKYALDGRDPNSYSGIFWVLGRFDRAWGPERPIFGKIRYMTSESTRRKTNVKPYVERHSSQDNLFPMTSNGG